VVGIGSGPPESGPRRADIHLVDFPEVAGHVITGPHPAVVVSSDRLNRGGGTVLVCPMTSRIRHDATDYLPPYLVAATARDSGLNRDGYVKVDQVFTRPVSALGNRIGRLSPASMSRLDAALRFVLSI
jgi:mRNA-degrading endonuclease toxin of MazEF toxin-antitoxin module